MKIPGSAHVVVYLYGLLKKSRYLRCFVKNQIVVLYATSLDFTEILNETIAL